MIDISVVIPVYNTEKYIVECVESVLANTQAEYEILCINDGSTDSSLQLLNNLAEKHDCIKVVSQENAGQSAARNKAIEMARGKYLYFLDSDDKIGSDALKNLLAYLEQEDLDVLYFSGSSFCDTKELEGKFKGLETAYVRKGTYQGWCSGLELMQRLREQKDYSVSPCTQIIRREFLLEHDISFYEGIIHEDNLFSFQVMVNAKRADCINDIYFYRRIRESSVMTKPKTYENLLGYFVCFLKMLHYVYGRELKEEEEQAVNITLRSVKANVKKSYLSIGKEEREKFYERLSTGDRLFFKSVILQQVELEVKQTRKIKRLKKIKNSLEYKVGRVVAWPVTKIKIIIVKIGRKLHG